MSMNPRLLRPLASGFDPRRIAGLSAWWDASDSATVTTDTGVSVWLDKVYGYAASQSTGANQPTLAVASLNGKNTLDFDGANDTLATVSFAVAQPLHIFSVMRTDTPASSAQNFYDGLGQRTVLNTFASQYAIAAPTGLLSGITANTSWRVFDAKYAGTASSLTVDGVLGTVGNVGTEGITAGMRFGGFSVSAALLNGGIAELMVYSGELSQAQRTAISSFLAGKWGLSLA